MRNELVFKQSARAMATFFEVALWGRDEEYLRSAAEEALDEVHRCERQLSFYDSGSDIREINVLGAERPVAVDPRVFRLLERSKELSEESGGAFDITIAPLLKTWGFQGGSGSMASEAEMEAARGLVGMRFIELNAEDFTVSLARPGVQIDLGAIGKGYAIERAAEIIRDAEIPGGLIHGGTSTVQAIGSRPDGSPWPVAIQMPDDSEGLLSVIPLADAALSVSAVHGKYFTEGDRRYGHVLDPRTGRPGMNALLAAVVCASATDSDALSTALLIRGAEYLADLSARPGTSGALTAGEGAAGTLEIKTYGIIEYADRAPPSCSP